MLWDNRKMKNNCVSFAKVLTITVAFLYGKLHPALKFSFQTFRLNLEAEARRPRARSLWYMPPFRCNVSSVCYFGSYLGDSESR